MKKYFISFIFCISIFCIFFSCGNKKQTNKETTTVSIENGQKVFKSYCKSCHGIDGTMGLNGAANLSLSLLSNEEKMEVITYGRKTMLSFQGILKPHEIQSVVLYIESLKK